MSVLANRVLPLPVAVYTSIEEDYATLNNHSKIVWAKLPYKSFLVICLMHFKQESPMSGILAKRNKFMVTLNQ